MWPWGHLGVAYLSYVALVRTRGREQIPGAVVAVAVGAAVPDLVDKPLAWTVAVLPSGRSLAHSLLVAGAVLAVAYAVARERDRVTPVLGLAVGWLSHLFVDLGPTVVFGLLAGDTGQLRWTTYLVWPLLPPPQYPNDESLLGHVESLAAEPYLLGQVGLFVVAVAVWVRSGTPGVPTALRARRPGRRR